MNVTKEEVEKARAHYYAAYAAAWEARYAAAKDTTAALAAVDTAWVKYQKLKRGV